MFYPPSWGGYTYPVQQPVINQLQDDRMVVNDDPDHPVQNNVHMESQDPVNTKGKGRASEDEVTQLAKENEEYHLKTRQWDIKDEPIPPEVLEIA
ncbi:hypothetical protein EDD18DRAFT_1349503 [Armillaria luteobubalina]|uniref:Uncharacterized protein n=1 Tax=Armillaria luteobubalina TaxID=153913 RepID=A0AA39QAJ0_9AGAR|nr:hypothetical protein EDD18DRAFT_1349503 [Armillaria luteobubalina]